MKPNSHKRMAGRSSILFMALLIALGLGTSASAQNTYPATGTVKIGNGTLDNRLRIETSQAFALGLKNGTTGLYAWMGATPQGDYQFSEQNGFLLLIIKQNGNVGIGTSTPAAKLDVNGSANFNGNVTASGNLAAKYQDVAEWVPATETMAPGTVVVLNPTVSNEVMPASKAYDSAVAGVVSAQPGLLLGEASPSKAQIATFGRVRVRATTAGGAINIGDLLVTSKSPGMAMKSEPVQIGDRSFHQPGTIIGKALEPLSSGDGEILVLLSLQ